MGIPMLKVWFELNMYGNWSHRLILQEGLPDEVQDAWWGQRTSARWTSPFKFDCVKKTKVNPDTGAVSHKTRIILDCKQSMISQVAGRPHTAILPRGTDAIHSALGLLACCETSTSQSSLSTWFMPSGRFRYIWVKGDSLWQSSRESFTSSAAWHRAPGLLRSHLLWLRALQLGLRRAL